MITNILGDYMQKRVHMATCEIDEYYKCMYTFYSHWVCLVNESFKNRHD
jgi:hypothetical protein